MKHRNFGHSNHFFLKLQNWSRAVLCLQPVIPKLPKGVLSNVNKILWVATSIFTHPVRHGERPLTEKIAPQNIIWLAQGWHRLSALEERKDSISSSIKETKACILICPKQDRNKAFICNLHQLEWGRILLKDINHCLRKFLSYLVTGTKVMGSPRPIQEKQQVERGTSHHRLRLFPDLFLVWALARCETIWCRSGGIL